MVRIIVKMAKKHSTAGIDGPELGARIRAIREMAGLSQERFAAALGFTRRQVVAWETAANGPPISILPTIRRVFDVDPEWVVMGPGLKPMRKVGQEEQDRRRRIEAEVSLFAQEVGADLSGRQISKLVNVILKKDAEEEPDMKAIVFDVLRTLARDAGA